ncbi:hypothetical protein D3C76_442180 [compost metagenome]
MIRHIFRHFAGLPFKLQALQDCATGSICGAELLAEVPVLLRSEQLASFKKVWGERLFYIPDEVIPSLWEKLEPTGQIPFEEYDVTLQHGAKPGLAIDIFKVITWIARYGLKLTSKGTVHQRSVTRLTELLFLNEKDVAGLGLKYPHQEVYRAPLAIVLDMVMSLGLIHKERASWNLNTESLSVWLGLTTEEMNAVLFRELLHRYVPDNVPIQHFIYRLTLSDIEAGKWYGIEALLLSMQEQELIPRELPLEQKGWMESWLTALSGFGWIDLGRAADGTIVFRWQVKPNVSQAMTYEALESEPESPSKIQPERPYPLGMVYVQPDFEILVPPDVSYLLRFELEAFSDNLTMDTMSMYRITRGSMAFAAESGRSPQEVLDLLEKSSSGVPDNVRLALEQWGREMGRTSLEEKLLLRCGDSEAADMISALSSLAGVVERIGPLDFVVNGDHEARVRKALEEIRLAPPKRKADDTEEPGYPKLDMPMPGASKEKEALKEAFMSLSSRQGWIFNGKDPHFYDPDTSIPEYDALFSGLREIPSMWVREMRAYHDSTARKILEQAITWRAKVKLSMGGEIMECIPEGIQGGEKWSLRGRLFKEKASLQTGKEVVLSPDDWEEMALVLPKMRK